MPKKNGIKINKPKLPSKKKGAASQVSGPPTTLVTEYRLPKNMSLPKGLPPITECAAKYFLAFADPWNPNSFGACIPHGNVRSSWKTTVFLRTTVTIGTAGMGFAALCPSLANDFPSLISTTAAFTQVNTGYLLNNGTLAATYVTGCVPSFHDGPYSSALLVPVEPAIGTYGNAPVTGRIVAVGMSYQYTGTVMNMGGTVYTQISPDHSGLYGLATNSMGASDNTTVARVTTGKQFFSDLGHSEAELAFSGSFSPERALGTTYFFTNHLYPFSQGQPAFDVSSGPVVPLGLNPSVGAGLGTPSTVMIFSGAPGNTFEVEVVLHLEYLGQVNGPTPSMQDPKGFELVQTAGLSVASMKTANPTKPWKTLAYDALRAAGKDLGQNALRLGAELLLSAL